MVAHQTDALAHNRCWLDRTALEGQISAAQTTLQAAIDALNERLVTAEDELTAIRSEMKEKNSAMVLALIVICAVFAVADGASLTLVMIRTQKKKQ